MLEPSGRGVHSVSMQLHSPSASLELKPQIPGVALKGSGQGEALGCCWMLELLLTVQYKRLGSPSVSLTCQQPPAFSPPAIAPDIKNIILGMETLVLLLTA